MGGTRSRSLCSAALDLWDMVLLRQGWVRVTWVPRDGNQLSNLLSKSALQTQGVCSASRGGKLAVEPLVHSSGGRLCEQSVSSSSSLLQLVSGSGSIGQGRIRCQEVARQGILFSPCPSGYYDFGQDTSEQGSGYCDLARVEDSIL